MVVYISGPITGVEGYRDNFERAERYLLESGHEVINPASFAGNDAWAWGDWLLFDLAHLKQAGAIALLPGWDESRGCRVEKEFAAGMDLVVLYLPSAVFAGGGA